MNAAASHWLAWLTHARGFTGHVDPLRQSAIRYVVFTMPQSTDSAGVTAVTLGQIHGTR
jgi:streptogramin lyase